MPHKSLELDAGASLFQLSLGLLGIFLLGLLEDGLRSAVDESLGLGQAEVGDGAERLDDLDILLDDGGEDDVALLLLFLSRSSSASNSGNSGNRSGSLDVELLLEGLHELGELDQGHLAEGFQQLIVGVLSHYGILSILAADEVVDPLPNKPYCLNYRSD